MEKRYIKINVEAEINDNDIISNGHIECHYASDQERMKVFASLFYQLFENSGTPLELLKVMLMLELESIQDDTTEL